jgi:hypothetical protein
MKALPTTRAAQLATPPHEEETWLIEDLWSAQAVGIIGGEPKCGKSFLALDLAVSVASGTPCLRHFATRQCGPVLLFAAEDAPHIVRQRLEGIAAAAGADFHSLDVHVITVPTLRLVHPEQQRALHATVAGLKPKLLVLDPLVRLHGIDENLAAEVAPLLGYLRSLQRSHRTAVVPVHHARKGAAHERDGQALRGSSELHAWGDSNLYLPRNGPHLNLSIEHRAAPGADRLRLTLKANPPALALELMNQQPAESRPTHHPPGSASNRSSPKLKPRSRSASCATPRASAPATSLKSWLNSLLPAASLVPLMGIASTAEAWA